jgi:hypothetical protein
MQSPPIGGQRRTFQCRSSPRGERRPAADHLHGRAPTPSVREPACDNNRRANEGVNANAYADAPPLFRWASQNLTAAAMLLCGSPEPATSEERRVRPQLKALLEAAATQQAKSSASRQRSERGRAGAPFAHGPNPPPSQHRERGGSRSRGVGVGGQEPSWAQPRRAEHNRGPTAG